MPGFTAEASAYTAVGYRRAVRAGAQAGQVVAAIPPCHACDDILDMCVAGRLRGAVCRYCAVGYCDPHDWNNPPDPFPRSEPWGVPF